LPVGQEIRDRFTGAVEAFARRNPGSGRHGDHSRHKSLADSFGTSNEAVSIRFSSSNKKSRKKKALPIKKVSGLAVVASKHEWRYTLLKRKYVPSVKSSIENESSKWKRKAISSFPCS